MKPFVYTSLPARVVFGAGKVADLAAEVERLGAKRVLLISTPGRAKMVNAAAKGLSIAGVFDQAVMHTPIELVERARAMAREVDADCCVALGGGSTIGFGKAIALTSGLPVVAVPTTYSGSEMTTIWGTASGGTKQVGRDPKVLPKVVIYDPELTLELPVATSAASGMNAMAHCVEALYAIDGNPVISLIAEEGIRALAKALRVLVKNSRDPQARSEAIYGAWLAGTSIGTTSVALHHKVCHVLGGLGLPHAQTHAVVLPHAVRYNEAAAPAAMQRIARALGIKDAAQGIYELEQAIGLPLSLAALGMKEEDVERAARLAAATPYPNPRPVEFAPVHRMLRDAYAGRLSG